MSQLNGNWKTKKLFNPIKRIFNTVKYYNPNRDRFIWAFGEWFGEKCCDNSLYFANYIASKHPEISCFWIAKQGVDTSRLDNKIRVLIMDTMECKAVLKKAGVIIMNQEFLDFSREGINYFGGGITVNLWHGLMWKKIGYDAYNKHDRISDLYHYLKMKSVNAKYWVASSKEAGEHLNTAFFVKGNHQIKAGYPRNKQFVSYSTIRSCVEGALPLEMNLKDNRESLRIILYMPTFRDRGAPMFSFKRVEPTDKLYDILKKYNAVIIEKNHFVNQRNDTSDCAEIERTRVFSLDQFNATELLAASDILVTDYSSCFFDYLLLDRPIIHYIYDYDYYVNDDRGVYYTKEEVACGKVPENYEELLKALEAYLDDPSLDRKLRSKQKDRFWQYDTEDACEKIYHAIIKLQKGSCM